MHITMRVACRIARACTREVATSVFTLAGLIVSAVAHAPCAVAFCSDAIQVIDSSTGIHRGKMEKRLEGGDFTKLLWLSKNLCRSRICKRNISSVALQLVRKMVEKLVNFDEIWKDWIDFSRWRCWLIWYNFVWMNERLNWKGSILKLLSSLLDFLWFFEHLTDVWSYSLGCTRSILQSR